jgi:hypothetical protein
MKTRGLRMLALFLLLVGAMAVRGQVRDEEVPGDNFSLEGALELFKKSESPQEFEKMLNTQDSKVNNLDLNGDGYIDYVRVIDRNEGSVHTFTLQAVISDSEVQDVAVIALEKKANGKAVLQIIGDEDVYGMETIIEPTQDVRVNAVLQQHKLLPTSGHGLLCSMFTVHRMWCGCRPGVGPCVLSGGITGIPLYTTVMIPGGVLIAHTMRTVFHRESCTLLISTVHTA